MHGTPQSLHCHHADILFGGPIDDVPDAGPGAVVIGEHHDIKAITLDGVICHLFEIWRKRGHAEKANFARLLEAIEGFVGVFIHESFHAVTRMDVHQVDPIRLQAS